MLVAEQAAEHVNVWATPAATLIAYLVVNMRLNRTKLMTSCITTAPVTILLCSIHKARRLARRSVVLRVRAGARDLTLCQVPDPGAVLGMPFTISSS